MKIIIKILLFISIGASLLHAENSISKEEVKYFSWAYILSSGKFYFENRSTQNEVQWLYKHKNLEHEEFYYKVYFKNNIPTKLYEYSSKTKNNKPHMSCLFDTRGKINQMIYEEFDKEKTIVCKVSYSLVNNKKEKMIKKCDNNITYIDYFYLPAIFDNHLVKSEIFEDGIKIKTVELNHKNSMYYIYDKNNRLLSKYRYINELEGIEPNFNFSTEKWNSEEFNLTRSQ